MLLGQSPYPFFSGPLDDLAYHLAQDSEPYATPFSLFRVSIFASNSDLRDESASTSTVLAITMSSWFATFTVHSTSHDRQGLRAIPSSAKTRQPQVMAHDVCYPLIGLGSWHFRGNTVYRQLYLAV